MKIGVKDNFIPLSLKESLKVYREWGIRGVELSLNTQEFRPDALSQSGRRELREKVHTFGLEICALGDNLGGDWYLSTLAMEKKIEEIIQALAGKEGDLATLTVLRNGEKIELPVEAEKFLNYGIRGGAWSYVTR